MTPMEVEMLLREWAGKCAVDGHEDAVPIHRMAGSVHGPFLKGSMPCRKCLIDRICELTERAVASA